MIKKREWNKRLREWEKHCVVGRAAQGEVEVRYDDRSHTVLDEVCANKAHVHLEKMDDGVFSLIVTTPRERAVFWIGSKNGKAHVNASEFWREPVNHRSEAAKCRENRKKLGAERIPHA